jgi:hypothetical protein
MSIRNDLARAALALILAVASLQSAAQWARLDGELTPVGAERAGNEAGTIPAWTGGLPTKPIDPAIGYVDPYAGDAVRFTITAANAGQYRDQLSAGHLALLQRHPESFRLNVYPTRRSAAFPAEVLAEVARQAPLARSAHDEIFDVGRSSVPFPIPQQAVEIMWNHELRWRGGSVSRMYTWFPVAGTGRYFTVRIIENLAFDQQGFMADARANRLANLLGLYLSPGRYEGAMTLVWEPVNPIAESRATWTYEPLARRVRRSPSQAYDFIDPTTDGLRTSDQYDGWSGAPDRYDWKLLGKREMLIGYNSYRLGNRALRYAEILQPGHVNPEHLRYELHRVWVVEATLRPGAVHRYPRRVFYVDEDTWQVAMEEVYDSDGQLWRFGDHQAMQFYDVPTSWYRATIHYDLRRNAYLVTYLDNEENFTRRWGWKGEIQDFMPSTLRRMAVR